MHRHTITISNDMPFLGAVATGKRENPCAHGNITRVDICECGARRKTNINGRHVETGAWTK